MGVVTATILSAGKAMDPSFELVSIDIVKEVNRIPYAIISLLDGSASKQNFLVSNDAFFEPGKEIEIKLRYEEKPSEEASVFKGLLVKQIVEANEQGTLLTVEMKDAAIKLTQARRSEVYREKADHDIFGQLIGNAGLTKGKLATTQPAHPEMVQYQCSDWDFILARAEANGLWVVAGDGKVSVVDIELTGEPKHTFEFGINDLYAFELEVDVTHQVASVESVAWDIKNQKLTAATKAKSFKLSQGNVQADSVAKKVGGALQTLSSAVPLDPKALEAWADGAMRRSRMSMLRGSLSIPGIGKIQCLDVMKVAGVGDRFNGKTLVTGVHHRVDLNGWQTDVQFGLSAKLFAGKPDVMEPPAAGQLPGVNGLQVGLVTQADDPEKEFRVKVRLPGIDAEKGEVWARLASPDAGKERGYFFRPEAGDEVIIGFFNDDPRQAVILGAMYSSKNTPPKDLKATQENLERAIVSKKGVTLGFVDEDKPLVFIETPGSNKIVFDDKEEMIQVSDQHGNSITLSKDGIEIKSAKDVKIEASGNVEIKGSKVDVK